MLLSCEEDRSTPPSLHRILSSVGVPILVRPILLYLSSLRLQGNLSCILGLWECPLLRPPSSVWAMPKDRGQVKGNKRSGFHHKTSEEINEIERVRIFGFSLEPGSPCSIQASVMVLFSSRNDNDSGSLTKASRGDWSQGQSPIF